MSELAPTPMPHLSCRQSSIDITRMNTANLKYLRVLDINLRVPSVKVPRSPPHPTTRTPPPKWKRRASFLTVPHAHTCCTYMHMHMHMHMCMCMYQENYAAQTYTVDTDLLS